MTAIFVTFMTWLNQEKQKEMIYLMINGVDPKKLDQKQARSLDSPNQSEYSLFAAFTLL